MRTTIQKIILGILASFVVCINASALTDALKVKVINGTLTDETVIRFLPTATSGFDASFDAYKLMSTSPTVPAAFTNIDPSNHLSINALPTSSSCVSVDLYTHIKVAGTYTLQSIELGAFAPDAVIILEDRLDGNKYAFRNGTSLSFSMSVNTVATANRFVIHFSPGTAIVLRPVEAVRGTIAYGSNDLRTGIQDKEGTEMSIPTLTAFQSNDQLQITIKSDELSEMSLVIYNTAGQLISNYSGSMNGEYTAAIQLPSSGTYIIRTMIGNTVLTKKLSVAL